MSSEPKCPKCQSENTYQDDKWWVCAECYHEWDPAELTETDEYQAEALVVIDANGITLNNGDSVMLIKDLKVKGSSSGIRVGTKVRNIRLVESNDGHNISCKIDGIGALYLKSEFVKKV
jgi:protein PhnA